MDFSVISLCVPNCNDDRNFNTIVKEFYNGGLKEDTHIFRNNDSQIGFLKPPCQ